MVGQLTININVMIYSHWSTFATRKKMFAVNLLPHLSYFFK